MGLLFSWSAIDWVILVVSLVTLAYLYSTWTFNYWKKRGVPSIKHPLPLFGHLKGLLIGRKSSGDVYNDIYKQLKGNQYGGFYSFRSPAVMVCDPELVKTVMVKSFSSFHDNDIEMSIDVDPMFGRNPFILKGDRWKTVRSQLTPAFTPGKIKPLFPLINEVCRDLVQYLDQDTARTEGLEAKELSSKFTTDVVATCAYGLNGNSFTDPKAAFREMGRNIMGNTWWRSFQMTVFFLTPKIAQFFSFRLFDETVTDFFRGVVKDAMDHREKNGVTRNDFLQMLMQLKAKGQVDEDDGTDKPQNEKFTDEDVAAQALTFFTDGFETSATTLSFALYELAVNQDVQARLRVEIDSALKDHGGKLTYEMLQEVPYLDMVLAETLRLYPPIPILSRNCTKPYDLPTPSGGVYRVAVGTSVVIPILALHTDPDYYPDPERFDPERFTEEGKASRHPYTYLPFGGGPRLCIGNRFGVTQVKAGIAVILASYDIELCQRTRVPLVLDPSAFLPLAKGGIWLKFIKHARN